MTVMDATEAKRLTQVFYDLFYTRYKEVGKSGDDVAIQRYWEEAPFEKVLSNAKYDFPAYQATGSRIVQEYLKGTSLPPAALELIELAFKNPTQVPSKKSIQSNYIKKRTDTLICCCIYMLEKFGYPDIVGDTSEYNANTACSIVASVWKKKSDTVRKIYALIIDEDKQKFDAILNNPLHQLYLDVQNIPSVVS